MSLLWVGGGGLVTNLCPTLATSWTVAHQACLSMEFSGQEHWSGLPLPSPADFPPGINPKSPPLQEDSLLNQPSGKPVVGRQDAFVKIIK